MWSWREPRIENSPSENHEPLQSLLSVACWVVGSETMNCTAVFACWLPEKAVERRSMPGEEPQRWKAELQLFGLLGLMPFCCLPDRAEGWQGGDVGMVCLCYRRLRQGVAPVYRSLQLSAFGGFAFAAAHEAPPGSGQCSAES